MAAVDWDDPCARAAALRGAYFEIVRGQSVSLIRVAAANGQREVRYTRPELATLRIEMERAEDECRAAQGLSPRPRRFAIPGKTFF